MWGIRHCCTQADLHFFGKLFPRFLQRCFGLHLQRRVLTKGNVWALRTFCPSSEMGANHTPAYPAWTCRWFYLLMERSGLQDGAGGIITTSLRPVLKNLTPWSVFCKPTWYVPSSVVQLSMRYPLWRNASVIQQTSQLARFRNPFHATSKVC